LPILALARVDAGFRNWTRVEHQADQREREARIAGEQQPGAVVRIGGQFCICDDRAGMTGGKGRRVACVTKDA
jgi:hypothetical protein